MIDQIQQQGGGLMGKLMVLGVLIVGLFAATLMVWGVVSERQARQDTASAEVAEQWSGPQTLAGPVLSIPVEITSVDSEGKAYVGSHTVFLLPTELKYESDVRSQVRTRGVYETPVYTSAVKGSGTFDLSDLAVKASDSTKILWQDAAVSMNVSDTRGVTSVTALSIDGAKREFEPSTKFDVLGGSGIHALTPLDGTQSALQFSFDVELKGSKDVLFVPLGENTEVSMSSDWNAPSFKGQFLPDERSITEEGFTASWKVSSFGKNIPQSWLNGNALVNSENLSTKVLGVGLYQEVDFYTMVDRATKYGILFICLTFLTFFMYEVLAGLRLHPMQYLLVGFAIALFYLLLLSLSEVIGFLPAYLVSATAVTLLITGYCRSILKAQGRAFSIAILLTTLYAYLYVLLQLEQLSLLFGSLLLFGVLGTVMYLTRNLDWHNLKQTS